MTNFVYDPKVQTYDASLWKTLTGAPAIANYKLVLNADTIINYSDLYGCDLTMRLIVPAVPVAGDSRMFGLASSGEGSFIGFIITEDVFAIYSADGKGNTKNEVVSFDAAWAATPIDFEVRWRGTYADFFINGVPVVTPSNPDGSTYRINDIAIPKGPLSIYIHNGNADDMELVNLKAKNIQSFI